MRKYLAGLLVVGLLSCLVAAAPPDDSKLPAGPPNASAITAAYLQDILYFLSSDVMEGRNTPSRGFDTAALFIASNLAQWGLEGGGDPPKAREAKLGPLGAFLYHFDLENREVNTAGSSITLGAQRFSGETDFTATATAGKGEGELLFVGPGYVQNLQHVNPYAGLDVKGKILVADGVPAELLRYDKELLSYYQAAQSGNPAAARPTNPLGAAGSDFLTPEDYGAQHGALAVIHGNLPDLFRAFQAPAAAAAAVTGNPYPDPPPNVPAMQVVRFEPPAKAAIPSLTAKDKLWQALTAAKNDAGARLRFEVDVRARRARTEDVVGILPGSDPVLKNQYLVISAHLDHIGISAQRKGDFINNGADDDGSGSTGLLSLAKAFATGPRPKRSVAFIWHAGEEKGLWGSLYFTRFPTIPLDQVVTDLNMDMIGRSKPAGDTEPADVRLTAANEIYIIGPEVSSSDLEHTLDTVNQGYYKLRLNHYYDRTDDPEQIFYRSDHVNYANQGIPILFFFDGVHVDYHRPGDEPQKIDYPKMEKVARTVYAVGWQLANQPGRPALNATLPPALVKAMAAAKEQRAADETRFGGQR